MKRTVLLLGAALAWPLGASAEIDYNYIQGDWVADGEIEADGGGLNNASDDYDGWGLEGSIAATPNVFVQASVSDLSLDGGDDLTLTGFGMGLNGSLAPTEGHSELYGIFSYEDFDADGGLEADGFGLTGGWRWQPAPGLEFNPSIAYLDYGDLDGVSGVELDGWRFGLRGLFNITDRLALNVEWRSHRLELDGGGNDVDLDLKNEIRLGARFYWL